jgi:hypothetical protein
VWITRPESFQRTALAASVKRLQSNCRHTLCDNRHSFFLCQRFDVSSPFTILAFKLAVSVVWQSKIDNTTELQPCNIRMSATHQQNPTRHSASSRGSSELDAHTGPQHRPHRHNARSTEPCASSQVPVWDCVEKRKVKMREGELLDVVGTQWPCLRIYFVAADSLLFQDTTKSSASDCPGRMVFVPT